MHIFLRFRLSATSSCCHCHGRLLQVRFLDLPIHHSVLNSRSVLSTEESSNAISENNCILGVIRGIEVNQSSLAHSITHLRSHTQAMLFRRMLESAGMSAQCVNMVEAHGTSTQAGDPIELESQCK
jgi:Beta-ketoacyl synthase, C-terminal domain